MIRNESTAAMFFIFILFDYSPHAIITNFIRVKLELVLFATATAVAVAAATHQIAESHIHFV